jgi:phosphate transport system substrate-binding protein
MSMTTVRASLGSATAIAATAMVAALGGPAYAQTINGAGATFPNPIYSKWFQAYSQAHPNVKFNYQAVGSGAGIAQYKAGTVFFGASDAPLSDAEYASMSQPTLHIPTVAGAVVLAYNVKGIGPGLRLSGDVIADIYLGKIKSWNDPLIQKQNPNITLPAENITVAHRSDGSGTSYIFTNYLAAVSPEWKSKVGAGKSVSWPAGLGGNGNSGVAGLVKSSSGGIGYVELAYAVQNKLAYGPVRNKAGNYVLASTATTTAAANSAVGAMQRDVRVVIVNSAGANAYPISGFTYLLVPRAPKDTAMGRALADFLKWAMGPGQQMADGLLYAPLPAAVVQLNERAIGTIKL